MKIIFIGGPLRGDGTLEEKKKNIEVAKKFVQLFIENKIPYYSPHLNIDQEITSLEEEVNKLSWDLNGEFLLRSDALAVLPGFETSSGTKMEIEKAKNRSIPIFYLSEEGAIQKIIDWLK